jgi:F-type H+-transporting ATPase subunit b
VLFDWFTVFAQIVNFLILIFLLRRFLYRPIINAMQDREKLVRERLEAAEQKRLDAEEERQRYQAKNQELREHFERKLQQAEEEVQTWRKQALQSARQEVDTILQEWRTSIRQEKDSFNTELRHFAVQQAYAVAGQAIRDLADSSLEERMVSVFVSQLNIGEVDLSRLKNSADGITLWSAFELPSNLREVILKELQAHLGKDLSLRFETDPDLTAGIELAARDGYQVAWNLRRYLDALEDELDSQFQLVSYDSKTASDSALRHGSGQAEA